MTQTTPHWRAGLHAPRAHDRGRDRRPAGLDCGADLDPLHRQGEVDRGEDARREDLQRRANLLAGAARRRRARSRRCRRSSPRHRPPRRPSAVAPLAEGRCLPSQAQWQDPTWVGLGFSMDDPHYYQYEFISSGSEFTARAIGNLDCDADFSSLRHDRPGGSDQRSVRPGGHEPRGRARVGAMKAALGRGRGGSAVARRERAPERGGGRPRRVAEAASTMFVPPAEVVRFAPYPRAPVRPALVPPAGLLRSATGAETAT